MSSIPTSPEILDVPDAQRLFMSASGGRKTLEEGPAINFLNILQQRLGMQPPKTALQLGEIFQNLKQGEVLTFESFEPTYRSWLKDCTRSTERGSIDELKPSPMSAFYSHPINKTYEVKVPVQGVYYAKIRFANPDDRPKNLTLRSEDETVLYVRKPTLSLAPRIGSDYLRLKFIGRKQPSTIDTRLALLYSDSNEVEEVLQFHVITEGSAPQPGEVLEPVRLQTPVNPGTAAD